MNVLREFFFFFLRFLISELLDLNQILSRNVRLKINSIRKRNQIYINCNLSLLKESMKSLNTENKRIKKITHYYIMEKKLLLSIKKLACARARA